jgi:hypothetical protein
MTSAKNADDHDAKFMFEATLGIEKKMVRLLTHIHLTRAVLTARSVSDWLQDFTTACGA